MTATGKRPKSGYVTHEAMLERLRADMRRLGSQRALAKELGVNESYLSEILREKSLVPDSIARHYSLRSERVYVTAESAAK